MKRLRSVLSSASTSAARARPTDYTAGCFIAAGAGFGALSAWTHIAAAWTPNLGASCLEIAATIAIVDRIVRREEFTARRPRFDYAMRTVENSVAALTVEVARRATPTVQERVASMTFVDDVLAATYVPHAHATRHELDQRSCAWICRDAEDTSQLLKQVLAEDGDLLDARLVLAVRSFAGRLHAIGLIGDGRGPWTAADRVAHELRGLLPEIERTNGARLRLGRLDQLKIQRIPAEGDMHDASHSEPSGHEPDA